MSSRSAVARVLALLLASGLLPAAGLLLFCAVTLPGKALAGAVGLMGVGPLLWALAAERRQSALSRLGKWVAVLGMAGIVGIALQAPPHRSPEGSRISSRYADGGRHGWRVGVGNVLPEIDQIHCGFAAAVVLDPLFNRRQKQGLAAETDALYDEMARDPEFRACGSAMPSIYREILGFEFRDGHYFHYIPPQIDRSKPSSALVFLHGSGGNFKAYTWLLSKVADRVGCTVIAPTFGLGEWEKPGAYAAVIAAISDAGRHAAIDPARIHLAGLSNGGKGVCLAESEPGPRFASIVLLSAVLHHRVLPEVLAHRLGKRPVLVLSGMVDDRVPWDYVSGYASRLADAGMDVTTQGFEGEDHFLLFRRRAEMVDALTGWLQHGP